MTTHSNVTFLLEQVSSGNRKAADDLFGIVYEELKHIAASQVRNESNDLTLQSTAIVHEVWIRLIGNQGDLSWNDRRHFFAAAAQAMRRILVDAARARKRLKRGGDNAKFELRDRDVATDHDEELLSLHDALEQLKQIDERKATLVTLRYFGGMTSAQAAQHLGISTATAERDWTFARAWLRSEMES